MSLRYLIRLMTREILESKTVKPIAQQLDTKDERDDEDEGTYTMKPGTTPIHSNNTYIMFDPNVKQDK